MKDFELLPKYERINRTDYRDWDDDYGNGDNSYKKIYRWLDSHLNEKHDEVFSLFCKEFSDCFLYLGISPQQYFKDNVETHTFLNDKKEVIAHCNWSHEGSPEWNMTNGNNYWFRHTYYIDPVNHTLKKVNKKKYKYEKKPIDFIVIGDYHQYQKIDGIWYELTTTAPYFLNTAKFECEFKAKEKMKCEKYRIGFGFYVKRTVEKCCFHDFVGVHRRQLSSKELKNLKIKND